MRDIRHRVETAKKKMRTRRAILYHTSLRAKASCFASRRTPCGTREACRKESVPRCYANKKDTDFAVPFCMRDIRHRVETANEIVRVRRIFFFRRALRAKASASPPPNPLRHARGAPQEVRPEMLRQVKGHRLRGAYCMRDIRHNVEATNEIVRTRRAFSFRRIMRAKASCCASRRTPCGTREACRKEFVPRCYAK